MSPFERTSQRREHAEPGTHENAPAGLVEELLQPIPQANLARGIVWADILADIAADEEARNRRDLPEAA